MGRRSGRPDRRAARLPHPARRRDRRRRPRGEHAAGVHRRRRDLQSSSDRSPGSLLEEVGKTLIYRVGGAAGPLYGTGFRQIGVTVSEAVTPDGEVLLSALRAGLEGIQALGAAAAGDKTMVDAWEPAVAAFERTLRSGGVTEEAARNAAEAANAGCRGDPADAGAEGTGVVPGFAEHRTSRSRRDVDRAHLRGARTSPPSRDRDRALRRGGSSRHDPVRRSGGTHPQGAWGARRDSASRRSRIGWGSRRQPSTACSARSSSRSSSSRTPTAGSTGWERPCSSSGTRSSTTTSCALAR